MTLSFAWASVPNSTQSSSLSAKTAHHNSADLSSSVSGFFTFALTLHSLVINLLPPKANSHLFSARTPSSLQTRRGTMTSRSVAPLFNKPFTSTFRWPSNSRSTNTAGIRLPSKEASSCIACLLFFLSFSLRAFSFDLGQKFIRGPLNTFALSIKISNRLFNLRNHRGKNRPANVDALFVKGDIALGFALMQTIPIFM